MSFVMDKLRILCEKLEEQRAQPLSGMSGVEYVSCGYKKSNTPPEDGWQPFAPGMRVGGADRHYWFRFDLDTTAAPAHTRAFLRMTTGHEGEWDARNPQGLLYLDGKMTQGMDTNHTEVLLPSAARCHADLYYYTGMESYDCAVSFRLEAVDERVDAAYYDFLVPYRALCQLDANSTEYAAICRVTERAADMVDMRQPRSEAYFASLQQARALLSDELYNGICGAKDTPVVNCIGHTHIDVAWLWTYAQTREKSQRSFATVLKLMEEYPEYLFMSSQPQLYKYVEQEAPELFERIRERIREGRWEAEGAMWLEADCNLISGESMVRQILYGKRYMQQKLGVDSRVLWLPDVFGYSAALPQILKKSGVDSFVTSKISWNETNCLPYDTFWWVGIDGTEIFTSFLTAQDYPAGGKPTTGTTYVANTEPSMILGTWNRYQQKEYNDETIVTFGFGDGGGGPTRHMLEMQRRMAKGLPGYPRTQMSFAGGWLERSRKNFEENSKKLRRTTRWVGELYLEYHRGTYTSQARNKRANRKGEFALQRTEALALADCLLNGAAWPGEALHDCWERMLRNQFHDVIPGSSIHEVYEDSTAEYAQVFAAAGELESRALAHLAAHIDAPQGGVLVVNATGAAHGGAVRLPDGSMTEVDTIPAWGWKVVQPQAVAAVSVQGRTVENRFYRLTLDEAGRIAQLWDKRAAREVFRPGECGNELQIFEDFPRAYDAWEISDYHRQKMWVLDTPAQLTPVTDGSRAGIRVQRSYLASSITQTVWLYTDGERIDFETELDWHDEHQLLKAAFPLDVHASRATYEIQFGSVERPTHSNTSWDAAKFEVCGHKWADLSENGYGVSLLNDCKYGHSAEGSTLRLTLLKCATYPDPEADKGRHTFTYSLLPHTGDWRTGHTVQQAYALNQPLQAVALPAQSGSLPAKWSLVHTDAENLMIDTVKRAEDSADVLIRLYDAYDRRTPAAHVTCGFAVRRAVLCDLMENEVAELPVSGSTVTVPVGNFEIVTLRVTPAV